MAYDLDRFIVEQERTYDGALAELRRGRKTGHWIWFIFPQVAGLGHSGMSQRFAISLAGRGPRIPRPPGPRRTPARVREGRPGAHGTDGGEMLGGIDAMKLRSSMTLFHRAAPDEPLFAQVLDRFYGGIADPMSRARSSANARPSRASRRDPRQQRHALDRPPRERHAPGTRHQPGEVTPDAARMTDPRRAQSVACRPARVARPADRPPR